MAEPQPIDRQFNETYSNSGIQPNLKSVNGVRKVVVDKRFGANDPTRNVAVEGRHMRQTIDQQFSADYARKGLQPSGLGLNKKTKNKSKQQRLAAQAAAANSGQKGRFITKVANVTPVGRVATVALASGAGGKAGARMKVARINSAIWSWGTFAWLWLQLPLAILGVIALAFISLFYGILSDFTEATPEDGRLATFLKGVGQVTVNFFGSVKDKVYQFIEAIFGINLSIFDPENIFFITYALLIGLFGVLQLFIIYLIYKLSGVEPFGGSGAGFKLGAVILTFIGYCVPLLNLLPWFFVWTGAVWVKPK